MQIDSSYIHQCILNGEGQTIDFKYHVANASKIAKTLVAFSNSIGGRLLLGVKDNGNIIGVESEEEIFMIENAAERYCRPKVDFKVEQYEVEEKIVLEIIINKGNQRPYYSKEADKWGVYVRHEDHNRFANHIIVQLLKRKEGKRETFISYTELENRILKLLDDDSLKLEQLQNKLKVKKRKLEAVMINLLAVQVIAINHDGKDFYYSLPDKADQPLQF